MEGNRASLRQLSPRTGTPGHLLPNTYYRTVTPRQIPPRTVTSADPYPGHLPQTDTLFRQLSQVYSYPMLTVTPRKQLPRTDSPGTTLQDI